MYGSSPEVDLQLTNDRFRELHVVWRRLLSANILIMEHDTNVYHAKAYPPGNRLCSIWKNQSSSIENSAKWATCANMLMTFSCTREYGYCKTHHYTTESNRGTLLNGLTCFKFNTFVMLLQTGWWAFETTTFITHSWRKHMLRLTVLTRITNYKPLQLIVNWTSKGWRNSS